MAALEAVLFASGDPLPLKTIADVFEEDMDFAENLLQRYETELNARESGGLTLRRVAGGVQLVTKEQFFSVVAKLGETRDRRLTAPAMETLSVIAYKQPITKQEIEDIRGVRVERSVAKLLELDLIDERGRKSTIGRPILYGTTETFLKCFGLNDLSELPLLQDFAPTSEFDEFAEDELFETETALSFGETAVTAEKISSSLLGDKDGVAIDNEILEPATSFLADETANGENVREYREYD